MQKLSRSTRRIPFAEVGPENPLPQLTPVDAEEGDYGAIATSYPYGLQDGYSRDRTETELPTIVLENDHLRAEFLPELGGRLFSLVDKAHDHELLHRNAILQPANLALRDAWFAGGVEWNIGATGHTPLTCSPVFAARITDEALGEGLRCYAWERIREVVYAIDFWLPENSPVLLVHVAITNPHDHDVPMYWWSNIAVPETDDLRVIVPATSAYRYGYRKGLGSVDIPILDGVDVSRPVNAENSVDYFFDLDGAERPWIAAVDGDGTGLVQTSTARLFGRKLFCWGRGPGGTRWQEFLSGSGSGYCEIQAGLARTQLERIPMPARTVWQWTETYGRLQADAQLTHGTDWSAAVGEVQGVIEGQLSDAELVRLDAVAASAARRPVIEILTDGDGWGALEQQLRKATGRDLLPDGATPFPDRTLTAEQQPWLDLLSGAVGDGPVTSYVAGSTWSQLLAEAPQTAATALHRGILAWQDGDQEQARELWRQAGEDPIALRCLAVTAADSGERAELLLAAFELAPGWAPLRREVIRALIDADRAAEAWALAEQADDPTGRTWLLGLEATLAAGELSLAEQLLADPPEVAGLREGELSLEELWFRYHERQAEAALGRPLDEAERDRVRHDHPIPAALDFRMAR